MIDRLDTPASAGPRTDEARAADLRASIALARERALAVDLALARLRETIRATQPAAERGASSPRPGPTLEPAAQFRWLLLDGHEAFCRGRYIDALRLFEAAAGEAPARIEGHLNIGRTLLRLRRVAEARAAFERVLSLEPGHPAGVAGVGDCDWRMGRPAPEAAMPSSPVRRRRFSLLPIGSRRRN